MLLVMSVAAVIEIVGLPRRQSGEAQQDRQQAAYRIQTHRR